MCIKRACVGEEDFRSLIESNTYYIDKTAFIKEVVNEMNSSISLITRPRRFGKTLALSMLREFFDITRKSDDIFSGLEIAEDKEFCDRHMNKYPVIYFPMKKLKAETFEGFLDRFRELAVRQTEEHNYLLTSPHVSDCLKYVLKAARKLSCNKAQLQFFLVTLSRALHQHWGKNVIMLIDDYDAPLAEVKQGKDYKRVFSFILDLLDSYIDSYVEFKIITGCLHIALDTFFYGVYYSHYGTDDVVFADKLGFTPEEVQKVLCDMQLSHKGKEIQEWYGGYCFGINQEIYCPWDVMSYISDLQENPHCAPQSYWLNTGKKNTLRKDALIHFIETDGWVYDLIQGKSAQSKVYSFIDYERRYSDRGMLWTLLYMTGCLTKSATRPEKPGYIEFRIPNKEILNFFLSWIKSRIRKEMRAADKEHLFAALFNGDEEAVTDILSLLSRKALCYGTYQIDFYYLFLKSLFSDYDYTFFSLHQPDNTFADDIICLKVKKDNCTAVLAIQTTTDWKILSSLADEALEKLQSNSNDILHHEGSDAAILWGIAFSHISCQAKCDAKEMAFLPIA